MNGVPAIAGSLVLLLFIGFLILPSTAQQSGSVTRGQTFTVTVVGLPRTAYDIWPKGTSALSGEPGDQPPVIVPGQVDVVQDPPGGPYVIGSHPISGGGTLRDDIPPDSATTAATSYYAEVKTDASGYGVVLFRTSSSTATGQQFHIVAQNPADLGEDVGVFLGGIPGPAGSRDRPEGEGAPLDGIQTPALTPVMPLPLPTTLAAPLIPAPTTRLPVTTTVALITPSPEGTPTETSPVQGIPLEGGVIIAAAGIGFFLAGRTERR